MATKKCPLRVFHNDVLFHFEDEETTFVDGKLKQTGFKEKTSWGFVYKDTNKSAADSRWGIVDAIGPDIDTNDINIGRRILVENLKWTTGCEFEKKKYWKTTDEFVLAVDPTED
jgi:hypothetical protein